MRLYSLVCILAFASAAAQQVTFMPMLGDSVLVPGRSYTLQDGIPVTIDRFRFYVGRFTSGTNATIAPLDPAYHLMDVEEPASLQLLFDSARNLGVDSLVFLLGVDSLTNVGGAFGGDLDPIHGMYWVWNSGYINVKLEGSSAASPYATHTFELHLGGYLPPHATAQRIVVPLGAPGPWVVEIDLLPLLLTANIRTRCNVMSPGDAAVRLSKVLAEQFSVHAQP